MKVSSLSSAAQTSLNALQKTTEKVADVAENVNKAVINDPNSTQVDPNREIARLSSLKTDALAQLSVFETVEELFAELASLPRR